MIGPLLAVAGALGIWLAPLPLPIRLLALVPTLLALIACVLDEFLTARARIAAQRADDDRLAQSFFDRVAAMPDPEWAQVVEPIEVRRLRSVGDGFPHRRVAGADS